MAKREKARKIPEAGQKLNWPEEQEGGDAQSGDTDDPTPRRSKFWRRFGIPWAWGAHHGGTTGW